MLLRDQTDWLAKALYSLSPFGTVSSHHKCAIEIKHCKAVSGLSNLPCRSPVLGRRSYRMRLVPTTALAWVYSRCQLL